MCRIPKSIYSTVRYGEELTHHTEKEMNINRKVGTHSSSLNFVVLKPEKRVTIC